jgi:hypothetical protein
VHARARVHGFGFRQGLVGLIAGCPPWARSAQRGNREASPYGGTLIGEQMYGTPEGARQRSHRGRCGTELATGAATAPGAAPATCTAPSRAGPHLDPLNFDLGRRHPPSGRSPEMLRRTLRLRWVLTRVLPSRMSQLFLLSAVVALLRRPRDLACRMCSSCSHPILAAASPKSPGRRKKS